MTGAGMSDDEDEENDPQAPDALTDSEEERAKTKGEKLNKFKNRSPKTTINWDSFNSLVGCCEDAVVDNIDEEYDRLIQHLYIGAVKAESSKVPRSKKRLSPETLELIRQRGIARAACNRKLTSELAKQCRQATKEDLKERKAAVLVEAGEAGKSIRKANRSVAICKGKMIALRRPNGAVTASRKAMENSRILLRSLR
ncbi:unnamed protein product [Angiostrongylus costaricensis]|uniref:RRP15-like protein n=1 Tax=Angiostrongylus costaricensis TaxID=334426 RepID=A0A0R3PCU0_ANGCS|nr:unnamed protein product [Angiostrongylus costaricensis]